MIEASAGAKSMYRQFMIIKRAVTIHRSLAKATLPVQ